MIRIVISFGVAWLFMVMADIVSAGTEQQMGAPISAQQTMFRLVEALAEAIAQTVLTEFRVPWVRVRINKKGAVRDATDVGVEIERGQK